ncbi:polymer-forming cytoskeletal protein [Candidatus Peregrinibacteria bacterium]|nr:MAG: polymer-forming cytoskeletal protein [Candidatus Peregrinibacteria bacterium]
MKKLISLFALVALLVPMVALGADFRAEEDLKVDQPIPEDLYAAGGSIHLNNGIDGDASLAGGQIMIDSVIRQDLNVAGGRIDFNGQVEGDARLTGGEVFINGTIQEDLIIAAGQVKITANSVIGEDLVLGAGSLVLDGVVNGDVFGGAGELKINGTVRGNVKLMSVDQLSFGPNGRVEGDLSYRASKEQLGFNEKVGGTIQFEPSVWGDRGDSTHSGSTFTVHSFNWFRLLSLLFVGFFFLWFLRHYAAGGTAKLKERPFFSFLIGFLIVFVTPVLAGFFAITLIGLPAAYLILLTWLMALYVVKLAAATAIGFLLVKTSAKKDSFVRVYLSYALGAFLFTLLAMLPGAIGWSLQWALVFVAIGGFAMYELELFTFLQKRFNLAHALRH